MKSLRLGKLFSIELELHWTFVFLALFLLGILLLIQPQSFFPITMLFFFLFLSVFLHELCHSVVAIQKGSTVKKIILLPIGGVSLSEELPEKPLDEFLIAIAGPAFNFLVVFVLLFAVSVLPLPFPWHLFSGQELTVEVLEQAIFSYPLFALLYVNLILGAFNLFLPALPLDGGRVFRSILGLKFGFNKATKIVTKVSVFLAGFLVLLGLLGGGIIILIIGVFVFLGAQQEAQLVVVKETMQGVNVSKLIRKREKLLSGGLSAKEALQEMLARNRTSFLVKKVHGFGIVSAEQLLEMQDFNQAIELLAKDVSSVQKSLPAEKLMERFLVKGIELVPVLDGKKFVGVIDFRELETLYNLEKLKKKFAFSKTKTATYCYKKPKKKK